MLITHRPKLWSPALRAWNLNTVVIERSVTALESLDRTITVIYDADYSPNRSISGRMWQFAREFPHLIVFDDRRGFDRLHHWTLWARLLYPDMPNPLYPRMFADLPNAYRQPLATFAVLYNVCLFPHLVDSSLASYLDDDYMNNKLTSHSSLLSLT